MPDWAVEGCMEQWRLQLQGEAEAREARAELRRKGISAPWVPFVPPKSSSSSLPKSAPVAGSNADCVMDQWPPLAQGEGKLKRKAKVVSKRPPISPIKPIKPAKPAKPANSWLWSQHDKDLIFKTFPDHVVFSRTVFETIRGQLERDCTASAAKYLRYRSRTQKKK
jgi:hypothetical protein